MKWKLSMLVQLLRVQWNHFIRFLCFFFLYDQHYLGSNNKEYSSSSSQFSHINTAFVCIESRSKAKTNDDKECAPYLKRHFLLLLFIYLCYTGPKFCCLNEGRNAFLFVYIDAYKLQLNNVCFD